MIGIILLDAIVEMSISEVVVVMIFFKVWEEKFKKTFIFLDFDPYLCFRGTF